MERRKVLELLAGGTIVGVSGFLSGCKQETSNAKDPTKPVPLTNTSSSPEQKTNSVSTSTSAPTPTPTPAPAPAPAPNVEPVSKDGLLEGKDYKKLKSPQPVADSKKIEIIEFFSYICPHCYALESDLEAWEKTLAKDVVFKRIPFALHGDVVTQKGFFALEALGKIPEIHQKVFDAIHKQQAPVQTEEQFADIVAKHGVARDKFLSTIKSFSVDNSAKRAEKMSVDYKISSVPNFVVQGQFNTSAGFIGATSNKDLFVVLDKLINKTRTELITK